MYFSVGWPDILRSKDIDAGDPLLIKSCEDQSLFAVLTVQSVYIWLSKPRVLAAVYSRCDKSVDDLGTNQDLVWSPAGDHLVLLTSKSRLLFFNVEQDRTDSSFPADPHYGAVSSVRLTHTNLVPVSEDVTCLGCIDGPCVATRKQILRYKWNASLLYALELPNLQKPGEESEPGQGRCIVRLDFHLLMRGIGVVFNTGEAAFWPNPVKNKTVLAWAEGVEGACDVALNGKFRLMAVGLECGKCMVFTLEEEMNCLQHSHTLFLASTDYPNLHLGAVKCMAWSPDGFVLAMSWKGFGLAVWSCFGSLLYASVSNDHKLLPSWPLHCKLEIYSLTWLASGFQLLFLAKSAHADGPKTDGSIFQMKFAKSALTSNPCFSNQKHLVLYSDKQVFLQPGSSILRTRVMPPIPSFPPSRTSVTSTSSFDQSDSKASAMSIPMNLVIGPSSRRTPSHPDSEDGVRGADFALQQSSQQPWHTLQVPEKYIQTNWPLRYVAVSDSARHIAVAGQFGLAHCTVATQRWKVFGNVSHESNIMVCGGLTWWRDMIVVPCHNFIDDSDEIRFYPQSSNLDNSNVALTLRVPCRIHLINLLNDCLSVVTVDKKLHLFGLKLDQAGTSGYGMIVLHSMPELSLAPCVPFIEQLISLFPSDVSMAASPSGIGKSGLSSALGGRSLPKSLVANVAGRLLVLSEDLNPATASSMVPTTPYCRPVALASSVEMVWSAAHSSSCRYLKQALWLGCGASGMKVWLPLFPSEDDPQPSYLSKRVMLTFPLKIYPLAICFEDALVIGTAQSFKEIGVNSTCSSSSQLFPFATIERTVQIYLHHVLRSLLRRNAVVHCEEIAQSCSSLPYFAHVLELMLHEVLEEEAVKRPQDALLPVVIDFLKLFPQYLDVVGRCARKTEVALWRHLFHNVGSPEELFTDCLAHNQLEMAASYLIIIQSIEAPKVSRQHATRLLNSSLEQRLWPLAKDLVRFLRTIAASSEPATPTTPTAPSPAHIPLYRSPSTGSEPSTRSEQEMNFVRPVFTTGDIQSSREEYFIDVILARHARKMLSDGNLRDLGRFVAYLDYPLKTWLTKERHRVGKVENFMACFQVIFTDFEWPLPANPVEFCLARRVSALDRGMGSDVSPLRSQMGSTSSDTPAAARTQGEALEAALSTLSTLSLVARDGASIRSGSVAGDICSDFGGEDDSVLNEETPVSHLQDSVKGSLQSERELRYLVSIMLSAGCFDWALLLAIVLRDSDYIHSILRVAREVAVSLSDPEERREASAMAERILDGLNTLCDWALERCEPFSPFLEGIVVEWQAIVQLQVDEDTMPVLVEETDAFVGKTEDRPSPMRMPNKRPSTSSGASTGSSDAGVCVIS